MRQTFRDHKRECKRKAADAALDEAAEVVSDLDNWQEHWPSFVEKANSTRSELRLSAFQSMNKVLTARYVGYEDFEPFIEPTFDALHEAIVNYASRSEHDEALGVFCNMSLNCFYEFEHYVQVFLDNIVPTLSGISEDEVFRFFTVAFSVAISVSNSELSLRTFNLFYNLLMNKKSRSTEFTTEMLAECVKSVGILLSSFPDEVIAENLASQIEDLIDQMVSNQRAPLILAAIDLIPIVYEAILSNEAPANSEEHANAIQSKHFTSKYKSKIANLGNDLSTKADQKLVKNRVKEIIDILSGNEIVDSCLMDNCVETITLNNQSVELHGYRRLILLSAIRRVTKVHFQQQMTENLEIRELFGFQLFSSEQANRLRKKHKGEIQQQRIADKKERQMAIDKKRRQKMERNED